MQSHHKSFHKYMFTEEHRISHREQESKHLTTFKTLASSSSNSPILIASSMHEEASNLDEDAREDEDAHILNIACTEHSEFDLNESPAKDQHLKSICILTGNLNKSASKPKQLFKAKAFTSTHNESLTLDTSQQTISSCTNINASINTIDTLDEAISAKRMLKQQHDQSCSSSICSSKSSSLISNIVNNQNLMNQNQVSMLSCSSANTVSLHAGYNTTGITASNSNSINDDASEQSSIQMITKDAVREVLEKDPKDRTDEDIDNLVEFMQTLPVSSNLFVYFFTNKNRDIFLICSLLKMNVCFFFRFDLISRHDMIRIRFRMLANYNFLKIHSYL